MRIMIAVSDRDLLQCYSRLLSCEGTQVDTAFDGVQTLTKLAKGGVDLLIVSGDIQRVDYRKIIAHAKGQGVPTLALLSGRVKLSELIGSAPANDYLALPFSPDELRNAIAALKAKLASDEELRFPGFSVRTSDFSLREIPLTAGEIDILKALYDGDCRPGSDKDVYINALNEKLARLHLPQWIHYEKQKGYRMVTGNE